MKGYRLLVKPKEIETTSVGGIVLVLDEKLEASGQQIGTVINVGDDCWSEYEIPWCKVGDQVLYAKFSGRFVYDPETKEEFMVMNDTDVMGVIE